MSNLTALRLLVLSALALLLACGPGRTPDRGDDDDEPARDPKHETADDSSSTSGSGEGDRTGDAAEGETYEWGDGDSTLYVVNDSGLTIEELYVTPCDSSSWGDDQLMEWVLPDGWFFVLTGLDDGCYDIEAWDASGNIYWDVFGADLDGEYTLFLLEPAGSGDDDDDTVSDDDDVTSDDDDVTEGCDEDEVEDCYGECTPSDWPGDGFCDENLNCAEWDFDYGDCVEGDDDDDATPSDDDDVSPGECAADEIEDCVGNCAPAFWVGDGYCDDGNYEWPEGSGILIYLNCKEHSFDGGDCAG